MKKYYVTVYIDDDDCVFEYDFIRAENEENALSIFKKWFLEIYGHYDYCDDARYKVEEC